MWLAFGNRCGPVSGDKCYQIHDVYRIFLYLAPSVKGFVVVGQMPMQYGGMDINIAYSSKRVISSHDVSTDIGHFLAAYVGLVELRVAFSRLRRQN